MQRLSVTEVADKLAIYIYSNLVSVYIVKPLRHAAVGFTVVLKIMVITTFVHIY
jgi:hypothetical protein